MRLLASSAERLGCIGPGPALLRKATTDTVAVIPDYAKLRYIVRAPTWAELEVLRGRVRACFEYV